MKKEITVRPLLGERRAVSLLFLGVGLAGLAAAHLMGGIALTATALIVDLAALLIYFASGSILNTVFNALGVHPIYRDVELVDEAVVALDEKGRYHAGACLVMRLRQTLGEALTAAERSDYLKSLENFLANMRVSMKVSLLAYPVDLEGARRKARRMYDLERAKEAEAKARGEHYREGTVKEAKEDLAKQLLRLERENMFEALCVATVYAADDDRYNAVEKAKALRENIRQGLATAYGAEAVYADLVDLPRILHDMATPVDAGDVQTRMQALFSLDLATRAWITGDLEPKSSELAPDIEDGLAIRLGETYLYGKPFYWIPGRLINNGIAILGTSGAGKSTTVFTLESTGALEWGINALIIDFNGEYVDYTRNKGGAVVDLGPESLNIMQLAGMDPATRIQQILNAVEVAFDLEGAHRQRRKMREYMEQAYRAHGIVQENKSTWEREPEAYPSLREVLQGVEAAIEEVKEEPRGQTGLQESLISLGEKIVFWTTTPNDFFCRPSTIDLEELLLNGIVCLNLRHLPDDKSKAMAALTVLDYVTTKMKKLDQARPGELRQLVILDEPWKIADETADTAVNPLLIISKEGRKYGFGLVVATQNIKDISPRALSNLSGMVIVLRMEDEGDIRRVCENFGIPEHLRSDIHYFDVWHGIVKLNYKRGARVFRGVIRPELKPETVRVRIPDPEMDDFPSMERYMRDVVAKSQL